MPGRADDERGSEALDRAWDALAAGAVPAADDALDPGLGASVRRLRDLGDALSPDPAFLRTLREDLMSTTAASPAGMLPGPCSGTAPNGRAPQVPLPLPLPLRSRRRVSLGPLRRTSELAAAAVLALAIVAGTLVGSGGWPAFLGLLQGDGPPGGGDVPMLGADPGRTGEQPGPGPEHEPGPRWGVYAGVGARSPVVVDGVVYLAGDTFNLTAYDAASGEERWQTALQGNASDPTIVDGTVYLGLVTDSESADSAGFVEAYDAATGERRWSAPTGSFGGASPVVVGGVVYGMGDAEVFAFDAATGEAVWHAVLPTGACKCTPPGVASAGGEVFAPGGNVLYALDAGSGQERWRFATEGDWLTLPVVADGRVYAGAGVWLDDPSKVGAVHAVDAESGDRIWTAPAVYVSAAPAVADGRLYVPAVGSGFVLDPLATPQADSNELRDELIALDAETGGYEWSAALPIAASQPAVVGETVYVAANSFDTGYVAAFDAATGRQQWLKDLQGSTVGSPAVTGGAIYVTTYHNGLLYALDDAGAAATPSVGSDPFLAEPCESGPRAAAGPTFEGTPRAGFAEELLSIPPLPESEFPSGPPASPADVAAIEETVAGLARCANADPEVGASYYSDDYFRRFSALVEGEPTLNDAVLSGWNTSPFAPNTVRDVRELPDGRVGAVVEGAFNPAFFAFIPSGDAWLVDEVVLLALADAGSATPTP